MAHYESLHEMKSRLFGIQAMMKGIEYACTTEREGALQIIWDCAETMERIADRFEAEQQLRLAEGRR